MTYLLFAVSGSAFYGPQACRAQGPYLFSLSISCVPRACRATACSVPRYYNKTRFNFMCKLCRVCIGCRLCVLCLLNNKRDSYKHIRLCCRQHDNNISVKSCRCCPGSVPRAAQKHRFIVLRLQQVSARFFP